MIELRGVGHIYSRGTPWARRALTGVDLDIGIGEGVLIVGPNGSGKSTLAWILAGLTVPSEGTALMDTEPLDTVGPRATMLFQHARLQLFRSTVARDILWGGGVDEAAVDPSLRLVGLDPDDVRDRRIDELSGGQQRRVALAGLMARRPELLILDEPFSGLDAEGQATLVEVLGRLRASGTAVVVVSHDYEDVAEYASRVVLLEGGRVTMDTSVGQALRILGEAV